MFQEPSVYSHQYEDRTISFELVPDVIRVENHEHWKAPPFEFLDGLKENGITPPFIGDFRSHVHIYLLDESKRAEQLIFLNSSLNVKRVRSMYKSGDDIFYGTGELIIIPDSEMDSSEIEKLTSGKVVDSYKGVFLVDFVLDAWADHKYDSLRGQSWIKHIEKNFSTLEELHSESSLKDYTNPIYKHPLPEQKAFEMTHTFEAHRMLDVHEKFRNGRSKVRIAILDSGVDIGHPDLKPSVDFEGCWDFVKNRKDQMPNDYDAHGTLCAGLLTAEKSHEIVGIDGVAKGCKLVSYRIGLGDSRKGFEINLFQVIKAILRAGLEEKVDVINCSWTFKKEFSTLKFAITEVIEKGRDNNGTIVVFSAGNEGKPARFPGNLKEVITVSAVDENGYPGKIKDRIWGSNFGDEVDIAAPGTNLVTTDIRDHLGMRGIWSDHDDYYKHFGATSGAAPQVAGCAALMISVNPGLKWEEVKDILKQTASGFPEPKERENYGSGILNVYEAVRSVIP